MKFTTYLIAALFVAAIFSFCKTDVSPIDGATLAKNYCSSCHLYPEPNLLDQKTWSKYVLPRMGAFMGIYQNEFQRDSLIEKQVESSINDANIFPKHPTLSKDQWSAIQEFYLSKSPTALIKDSIKINPKPSNLFKSNFPDLFLSPPSTTFIDLQKEGIQFGDANKKSFAYLDQSLKVKQQAKVGEGLIHVEETNQELYFTVMGAFSPSDFPSGYVLKLSKDGSKQPEKIIQSLQRPVHANYSDFNNDGLKDILICEYGKWTGCLSLWTPDIDGVFTKKVLINKSGAIRTEVLDADNDGKKDILVLFGQGDEGIVLLKNLGDNNFKSKILLRFHPSMGSSYFSLFDYDNDGKQDIIYTAGDNADYPSVPKPYHGIYIFKQEDNFEFKQEKFLALHGAYKAIPADYDLDGDLDIAAISFFPDYSKEKVLDFIIYKNDNNNFEPESFDLNNTGRSITMDAEDYDQDGDIDLAIGSLTFEVPQRPELLNQWINNGLPFLILENQSK